MKKRPTLPTSASAAWHGGFALDAPTYTSSVAAAGGTVLGGGERLYLLRPGATHFSVAETPAGVGDAVDVAVDPRRRGRFAIAGMGAVAIFDGKKIAVVQFRDPAFEIAQLAWGEAKGGDGSPLFIRTDTGTVLRLMPGASDFDQMDLPPMRAMASDASGRMAFACFREEDWTLEVRVGADANDEYVEHYLPAPSSVAGVHLAVAGHAVAVGFEDEEVWLTRRATEEEFRCVDALCGGPLAFQGPEPDSALFGTAMEGDTFALLRVDARGVATRIGELEVPTAEKLYTGIRGLAWDASRRTLWASAGRGGLLCSTAPGAPRPGAATVS